MTPSLCLCLLLLLETAHPVTLPPAMRARYHVLSAQKHGRPPVEAVHFTSEGSPIDEGTSWKLTVYATLGDETSGRPLFELIATTDRSPLGKTPRQPLEFSIYRLRVPQTNEDLEYVDGVSSRPLLPVWNDFQREFLPWPAAGSERTEGFPRTCTYLGHVLTLRGVDRGGNVAASPRDENVRVLRLDSELFVGTGRVFKDSEGHRLPQTPERQNYTYVPFTREDYARMIEAGCNLFGLVPGIGPFVRGQPVFYRRGLAGDPPLSFPTDLYRSNYRGPVMFEDEPACIMIGDEHVHRAIHHLSDATALLGKRVRARYLRGARQLEDALRGAGIGLGDLSIVQLDYPVWETRFETAYYQLRAGFSGFVHEGRYDLDNFYESAASFDAFVEASTGLERKHTGEEMLRYIFAFLRGAARRFDKDWGISIYGQADPELSPVAVKLAYDMGARYVWFWTSDHDHHLPWNEQLELARTLKRHAGEHPRDSIRGPRKVLDKLLLVPFGYFPVLESPTGRRNPWDLWWAREMDREGRNEASRQFRRRMRALLEEVHKAFDGGEDFDISVDDGAEVVGYRTIVRVES